MISNIVCIACIHLCVLASTDTQEQTLRVVCELHYLGRVWFAAVLAAKHTRSLQQAFCFDQLRLLVSFKDDVHHMLT